MRLSLVNTLRVLVVVPILAGAGVLVWWRGPDWANVRDAFAAVSWTWVFAAIGINLVSVLSRAVAWDTVIKQSLDPPTPRFPLVFSAFSVGLFANAVLPGRVGELARVAVLRRRLPGRRGATATLIGSVFAHRMFDLFPAMALVAWVLLDAKLPHWALTVIGLALGLGGLLFLGAWALARRHHMDAEQQLGTIRLLIVRARKGLAVMRAPIPALTAAAFQFGGWTCQLFAVWATMRAFHIHQPVIAAALVLVMINVATIFPVWPGNVGLVQAAIALPLVSYGVAYGRGVAFGIGLQAIEASVGVGVGLIFLAREGLSYATLKELDQQAGEEIEASLELREREPAGARVSG